MNERIQESPSSWRGTQPCAPSNKLCQQNSTSYFHNARSIMHAASPRQRQPEKPTLFLFSQKPLIFQLRRHEYSWILFAWGAPLHAIPISEVKSKLLLNCRTPMDTLLLITLQSARCLTLRDAFFSWAMHLFTPLCFWNAQNVYN